MAKNGYDQTYEDDRRENEETADLPNRVGRMLRDKVKEDLTGGAYVGSRLNVGKDRGSRLGRVSKEDSDLIMKQDAESGMNANPKMGGMNFKKGGKVKSASARADGCAIRGKTRA